LGISMDSKNCAICGTVFYRGKWSFKRWESSQTCSNKCRGVYGTIPAWKRFWDKVEMPDDLSECWNWSGGILKSGGYGAFQFGGNAYRSHRWSWQCFNGPIPNGLVTDHLCGNPRCVNPFHMELVTRAENNRRARLAKKLGYPKQWAKENVS